MKLFRHMILVVSLLLTLPGRTHTKQARWSFNGTYTTAEETNSPPPATGTGTATPLGGLMPTFSAGAPADSAGKAWSLAKFPAQGSAPGTAGVRFAVSTVGFEKISVQFQQRFSSTASGHVLVRSSVNGVDFADVLAYDAAAPDLWTNLVVDLAGLTNAADNAAFAIEIVSGFAPGTAKYAATKAGSSYSTAGTWRFDLVTVTGEPMTTDPAGPRILVQPAASTNLAGTTVRLGVGVAGAAPLTYQWQFDQGDLPGATGPTLTLTNLQPAQAGRYRVVITNPLAAVTSAEAEVTVIPPSPPYLETDIASLRARVATPNFSLRASTEVFAIEGIVTTHANLASPTNVFFFLQDETGGLAVSWRNEPSDSLPPVGARVRAIGPLAQVNGLLQLAPNATNSAHSVAVLSLGNPLPPPVKFDFGWTTDDAQLEAREGRRILVEDVTLDTAQPNFPNYGTNLTITSALTGQKFVLRVDGAVDGARVDLADQPKPAGVFSIIGVLSQADTTSPFTGAYHVLPTRYGDLIPKPRAPRVRWTNVLENLIRPGDAGTNTFAESVLRPGETLRLTAEFSDDGQPLQVAGTPAVPPGATVNFTVSRDGDDRPTNIVAHFDFTATATSAGVPYEVVIAVANDQATNSARWKLYVPTAAEQWVTIAEFLSNPTAKTNVTSFNPLHRDVWPPTDDPALANRITIVDEYVEVVNFGPASVNLGGWTLSDSAQPRAWLPPGDPACTVPAGSAVVIFGGPAAGFPPRLPCLTLPTMVPPGAPATSDGLSLNNSGDVIALRNAAGNLVERIVYAGNSVSATSSLTRWPATNGPFVAHAITNPLRTTSAGTQPGGDVWGAAPPVDPTVPLIVQAALANGQVTLSWRAFAPATFSVHRALAATGPWSTLTNGLLNPTYSEPMTDGEGALFRITSP